MKKGKSILSTKANTLKSLSGLLTKSKIEKIDIVIVGDFIKDASAVCSNIKNKFGGAKIVVRSSSANEDSYHASNAGHYESVLNVDSSDEQSIYNAVAAVRDSYTDIEKVENEQILVQQQTDNVLFSGVIFGREIQSNLPYYMISYDDNGSTDSVTSGQGGKTLIIARDIQSNKADGLWGKLIDAVREIEDILEDSLLDIEFAITADGEVVIFQVRPLAVSRKDKNAVSEEEFTAVKSEVKDAYEQYHNIYTGKTMSFSDMAFWNPAEIIGVSPRTLDYSLYREIITKDIWSSSLVPMGYKYVREELMYQIGNKPYISLDYSFYGLIPDEIDEELSGKIVDFYMQYLARDFTAHDKIEFEVVFGSYDFMTASNSKRMYEYGFTEEEVAKFLSALKKLTISAIQNYRTVLSEDKEALDELNSIRVSIENMVFKTDTERLSAAVSLTEKLRHNGTTQFARQARYAFMARAFCRTLADAGYFTEKAVNEFMTSLHTVSSEFDRDFTLLSEGRITKDEFNCKYGHLRSGTYNIRTRRYDEMDFANIRTKTRKSEKSSMKEATLNTEKMQRALDDIGFNISAVEFIDFLKISIEQREYFKFEFTKTLSFILYEIRVFAEKNGLKKENMSWLSISEIKDSLKLKESGKIISYMKEKMNFNRSEYYRKKNLVLPDIIFNVNDFDIIKVMEARPNFITSKKVEGQVVILTNSGGEDIEGKIVAVPQADPGYEWIFTKGIKGFITKYGGAASHMAIRCAEFDIPGAIGCGEKIYDFVCGQEYIKLDCKNGIIR